MYSYDFQTFQSSGHDNYDNKCEIGMPIAVTKKCI